MSGDLKILHTSDWHLGKKLYRKDRVTEHLAFFSWILAEIDSRKIDVLIIAGDIFDSPNPPHDAQKMLWDFFTELAKREHLETLIISGNHDSGKILQAPGSFLSEKRIHVTGLLDDGPTIIKIKESEFVLFPYFRLSNLLTNEQINADEINDQFIQEKIEEYITQGLELERSHYRYLIAHHQFGSFNASGTEQGLYLSGIESISLKNIANYFDYIALGHIHKHQKVQSSPPVYYSGSPIPFRFSESNSKKVILIDEGIESLEINTLSIPQTRPLVRLKIDNFTWNSKLEKLIASTERSNFEHFYLELNITLLDAEIGLLESIKEKLKTSKLELVSVHITPKQAKNDVRKSEINDLSTVELFNLFYKFKFPESTEVPEELNREFKILLEEAQNQEVLDDH